MLGFLVIFSFFPFFILSYYKSLNTFVKVAFVSALTMQFILARLNFYYTNLSFVFLYASVLLLVIINANKIINNKYSKIIFVSQIIFLVYIALTSFIRGDFMEMVDFTKFYFFGSFLFLLIITARKELNITEVNRFIVFFTIFLSFLGVFQYLFPVSSNFFVIDLTKFGYNAEKTDLFKRVVGLSLSSVQYGNLLALLLTYTIALIIKKDELRISKYFLFIGIFIGFFSIILTGIRTSLFSVIVGIIILAIIYRNKKILIFICLSTIALFLSWEIIITIGDSYHKDEGLSNPVGRSLQLFSFFYRGSVSTESTFSFTVLALQEFFRNPIIGSGDEMRWLQAFSITDAYLLYHLVQFGIMGVFIIFFPYLYVTKRNKMLKVLFVVLLIQTFTDTGLFQPSSYLSLWIIFGINMKGEP